MVLLSFKFHMKSVFCYVLLILMPIVRNSALHKSYLYIFLLVVVIVISHSSIPAWLVMSF